MRKLLSTSNFSRMLSVTALFKRRPRLHLIKLISGLVAVSFVAVLYGQHVLRSGGEFNAVPEAERRIEIALSQESGAASNAGRLEFGHSIIQ